VIDEEIVWQRSDPCTPKTRSDMERDDLNRDGLDPQPLSDRCPQSRRSALESRSCEWCGRPLTGRKERFCSDRCRMRDRREQERKRVDGLLQRLESGVHALRDELL
jgi:predicted nucleic acid-binding Zn ribbon protein